MFGTDRIKEVFKVEFPGYYPEYLYIHAKTYWETFMFAAKEEMKLKHRGNKISVFTVSSQKKYYRNLIEPISA